MCPNRCTLARALCMCLTAACLAGAFAMVYSFVTKTMNILALERAKGNRKMQKRVKKVRTHTRLARPA